MIPKQKIGFVLQNRFLWTSDAGALRPLAWINWVQHRLYAKTRRVRNLPPFHAVTSTWRSKPYALTAPVFFDKNNPGSLKCSFHCEYRILRNLSPLPFKVDNGR